MIRNAGGVITDDEIRSLAISQHKMGTRRDHARPPHRLRHAHFSDAEFRAELEDETGVRPPWAAEAFEDLDVDVRQSIARIKASPFIPRKNVRGFVYEVETGKLREVS